MKQAVQFVLRCYKRFISPMLPHACRFVPTCSEYAMEAVTRHGVIRGSLLAAGRLLRCHPFARAGYDPVPTPLAAGVNVVPADLRQDLRPFAGEPKLRSLAAGHGATVHMGRQC
jgi:uncharacterized protein